MKIQMPIAQLGAALCLGMAATGALGENQAGVVGNCWSIQITSNTNATAGFYFTTYDGTADFPLYQPLTGDAIAFSGEWRPRSGFTGTYEADWVNYLGPTADAYGSFTASLPTPDSDADGLPDYCQQNLAANVPITWLAHLDWPTTTNLAGTGMLTRAAGSAAGQMSLTTTSPTPTLPVSQFGWEALSYTGTIQYHRGTANTSTWDISRVDGLGRVSHFTGFTTFMVDGQNRLSFPQFIASGTVNGEQTGFTVTPSVFNRAGNRYIGNLALVDGSAKTDWRDYGDWVFVITDPNDANTNGIPDLSDSDAPPSKPALSDYDGDGVDDILWQSTSGPAGAWLMPTKTWSPISTRYGSAWKIVGMADVNEDGVADLVWQIPSRPGHVDHTFIGAWLMPTKTFHYLSMGVNEWTAVTTGDVNGDGKADLIWQHPATHEYGAWLMPAKTWQWIAQGDHGAWKIVAVADVDGDDRDDLIWQNSTTTDVGAWLMPSQAWQWVSLGDNGAWKVVGASDVNGDGKADLLWQNSTTTEVGAWLLPSKVWQWVGLGNNADWRVNGRSP